MLHQASQPLWASRSRNCPVCASGKVTLSDLDLTVDCIAKDPEAHRNARKELTANLPIPMKLAGMKLAPPTVSPYLWSAEFDGKAITLDGFVADDDARSAVLDAANDALPDVVVKDEMQIAAGAPDGVTESVSFALQQLPRLTAGSVALSDLELSCHRCGERRSSVQ